MASQGNMNDVTGANYADWTNPEYYSGSSVDARNNRKYQTNQAAEKVGLNAPFEGRLVFKNEGHRERAEKMIDGDIEKIWDRDELCSSNDAIFIGTGVCDGRTNGVKKDENGKYIVQSEIIDVHNNEHKILTSER